MNRRHLYIFAALATSLFAAWWVTGLDEDTGELQNTKNASTRATTSTRTNSRSRADAASTQIVLLTQLAVSDKPRAELSKLGNNPFAPASFQPPPPPPPPAPPPMKPTAPPLRFQYQGLLREDGKLAVFIVDGSELMVAREGQPLGGNYRVQSISENNIVVEYLPLHELQTLNFGRQQ